MKKVIINNKQVDVENTKTVFSWDAPTPVWAGKLLMIWATICAVGGLALNFYASYIPENIMGILKDTMLFSLSAIALLRKTLGLKEK